MNIFDDQTPGAGKNKNNTHIIFKLLAKFPELAFTLFKIIQKIKPYINIISALWSLFVQVFIIYLMFKFL